MKHQSRLIGALALSAFTLAPAAALAAGQSDAPWNRKVVAASITDAPDGNGKIIRAMWKYEGDSSLGAADLSARIQIRANGQTIWEEDQTVEFAIAPGDGPCPLVNCGQPCGTGSYNGQFVPLTCYLSYVNNDPDQGEFCTCSGPVCEAVSAPVELEPFTDIIIVVTPLPGSEVEFNTVDDFFVFEYDGTETYWDRRLEAVHVEPSPNAPGGLFDISYEVELATKADGFFDLNYDVALIKNGAVIAMHHADGTNWTRAQPCGFTSDPCGNCGFLLNGDVFKCDSDCNECKIALSNGLPLFPAIPITPNDFVEVQLIPAPGALPELPGFDEDNTQPVDPFTPSCPADINNDGSIDALDLGILLGQFGSQPGQQNSGDLNNDGAIDALDLGILLGLFGSTCAGN